MLQITTIIHHQTCTSMTSRSYETGMYTDSQHPWSPPTADRVIERYNNIWVLYTEAVVLGACFLSCHLYSSSRPLYTLDDKCSELSGWTKNCLDHCSASCRSLPLSRYTAGDQPAGSGPTRHSQPSTSNTKKEPCLKSCLSLWTETNQVYGPFWVKYCQITGMDV